MKFIDKLYLLLSYTNATDIKVKYPKFKTILLMNIFGIVLYFAIPHFLARAIYTLLLLAANLCFKETRGIVITFIPIILWILLFAGAKDIPLDWRRPIDVNTLYKWESKLGSFCFKFNEYHNVFLDLFAWLPYGIVHYIMPVLVGFYLVIVYKPYYTSSYLFFFGIMNFAGVLTQLIWPTSPPWYYQKNETNPADYTMHGDPAGLQRIDDLFHISFYYPTFTGNPLPWGAWPSLHSGFASYSAVFLTYLYPMLCPVFFAYVAWIWWATMYLGHHYLVDLLGGFVYALVCALGAIIYLHWKKPYHKDYAELKSIMIQEYDLGLLSKDYSDSKHQAQKPYSNQGEYGDSEKRLINDTVRGSSTINDCDSSIIDQLTAVNDEKRISVITVNNNNKNNNNNNNNNNTGLNVPNDPNLDRLSVMSNIDRESSVGNPLS